MSQAEVVENKRLGAALALIKAQQDASRLAATAHGRPSDTRALVGQCDRCNLARASNSRPRTHAWLFGARVPQHRDRAGDEQATDGFVVALAGSPQSLLPPLEFCRGVIPSHAANSRPDRNSDGSVTVAAIAVAPMTTMPGMVASKRLTLLSVCHLVSRTSISRTRDMVSRSWSTIVCRIDRASSGSRACSRAISSLSASTWRNPCGAMMPNSAMWARNALTSIVRWRTSKPRARRSIRTAC